MRLRIGHPGSLLVIAPHPDDETIGAYGLMRRLRRRGVIVHVLVIADGAASHPASAAWPRQRLVQERRRETRRAVRRIGVAAQNVTCLGLPDGALDTVAPRVRRGIARAIGCAARPLLVAGPAVGDDHPDHRVVAAAIRAVRRPGIRRLAFPVWPAGDALPGARALPLTAVERLGKRHAIRSYATQTGRITDDPGGFALTRAQIAAFCRPAETFVDLCR